MDNQEFEPMPNPSEVDLRDHVFEAIWQATKSWDVNAPRHYRGYCGMNGSHVKIILDAIRRAGMTGQEQAQQTPT